VWFLIDVIDGLDTTAMQALRRPGRGRPGYDPRMLAVLLVRHEALFDRTGVKGPRRLAVAAAR